MPEGLIKDNGIYDSVFGDIGSNYETTSSETWHGNVEKATQQCKTDKRKKRKEQNVIVMFFVVHQNAAVNLILDLLLNFSPR